MFFFQAVSANKQILELRRIPVPENIPLLPREIFNVFNQIFSRRTGSEILLLKSYSYKTSLF